MQKNGFTRFAVPFVVSACTAVPSQAAPVTFEFTGIVQTVSIFFGDQTEILSWLEATGMALGSGVAGRFTFESTTADVDPAPSEGRFDHAMLGGAVTVGGVDMVLLNESYNTIIVTNSLGLEGSDFLASFGIYTDHAEVVARGAEFYLIDGILPAEGSLPLEAPDLSTFVAFDQSQAFEGDTTQVRFWLGDSSNSLSVFVHAEITSLVTPVPLPATLLLFASALAGVLSLAIQPTCQLRSSLCHSR